MPKKAKVLALSMITIFAGSSSIFLIDNVIKCSELKWKKHISNYSNRFLYDKDNKIFSDELRKLGVNLIKSK